MTDNSHNLPEPSDINLSDASEESLQLLIPKTAYDSAVDAEKVQLIPVNEDDGCLTIVVVEHDYPRQLTDESAWSDWQSEIAENSGTERDGMLIRRKPTPPANVNPLHANLEQLISTGKIHFTDRVLLTCKLQVFPQTPHTIYVDSYDGESHKGIGTDFYQNALPQFAKTVGKRFLVGHNREDNITFFVDQLGRSTYGEVLQQLRTEVFPTRNENSSGTRYTVQFLFESDQEKYLGKPKSSHE